MKITLEYEDREQAELALKAPDLETALRNFYTNYLTHESLSLRLDRFLTPEETQIRAFLQDSLKELCEKNDIKLK